MWENKVFKIKSLECIVDDIVAVGGAFVIAQIGRFRHSFNDQKSYFLWTGVSNIPTFAKKSFTKEGALLELF